MCIARLLGCYVALGLAAASASAQTFSSATPITINASGNATPYPDTIGVVGGPAVINSVTVTLNNFTHADPNHVDILLVGPTGIRCLLMSDVGGTTSVSNRVFTFVDGAPPLSPSSTLPASGVYAPSDDGVADVFGAPAPAAPYGTLLSGFNGTNANGTWSLYVVDDTAAGAGSIGGWSITFNAGPAGFTAASSRMTYQGRLTNANAAYTGAADVQFVLWRSAGSTNPADRVGPTLVSSVTADQGLFTALLDFGAGVMDNKELFLELAVRLPGDPGFTTLSPRQRITAAPTSQFAIEAGSANRLGSNSGLVTAARADEAGNVGFGTGTAAVDSKVQIAGGTTVALTDNTGYMVIGEQEGLNMVFDQNELQVRNNGAAATLFLNFHGGQVQIGSPAAIPAGTALAIDANAAKPGGGAWAALSDPRTKRDIEPLSGTLDKLMQLHGYSFFYNDQAIHRRMALPGRQMGLMADEVERVFPEWISRDDEGTRFVTERATTALMVEALRDLRAEKDRQIAERDQALARQREQLRRLEERLSAIEAALPPPSAPAASAGSSSIR